MLHKRTEKNIRIGIIELGEDIIDEENDGEIQCSSYELSLDHLESEEEHLHLSTREVGLYWDRFWSLDYLKSPIISMWANMCMPCEDVSFSIFSEIFYDDLRI